MKLYAGVGSRRTPPEVLVHMEEIAERLAILGWTLRSGHAPGADQAFERGAGPRAEVYLPWPDFEKAVPTHAEKVYRGPTMEAFAKSAQYHPTWYSLKQGSKRLMARNAHQVLGLDLLTPVKFLVCWTPGARGEGGTGQAIRIARHHDIEVIDLAAEEQAERVAGFLGER